MLGLRQPECAESRRLLFDKLKGDMVALSLSKFGSNVVEKCLQMGPVFSAEVAEELLQPGAIEQLVVRALPPSPPHPTHLCASLCQIVSVLRMR